MTQRRQVQIVMGILLILIAVLTPIGGAIAGESTYRMAIFNGVIAGIIATHRWLSEDPLFEAKERRRRARQVTRAIAEGKIVAIDDSGTTQPITSVEKKEE